MEFQMKPSVFVCFLVASMIYVAGSHTFRRLSPDPTLADDIASWLLAAIFFFLGSYASKDTLGNQNNDAANDVNEIKTNNIVALLLLVLLIMSTWLLVFTAFNIVQVNVFDRIGRFFDRTDQTQIFFRQAQIFMIGSLCLLLWFPLLVLGSFIIATYVGQIKFWVSMASISISLLVAVAISMIGFIGDPASSDITRLLEVIFERHFADLTLLNQIALIGIQVALALGTLLFFALLIYLPALLPPWRGWRVVSVSRAGT